MNYRFDMGIRLSLNSVMRCRKENSCHTVQNPPADLEPCQACRQSCRLCVMWTLSKRIGGIRFMVERSRVALRPSKPVAYPARNLYYYCPRKPKAKINSSFVCRGGRHSCQCWRCSQYRRLVATVSEVLVFAGKLN